MREMPLFPLNTVLFPGMPLTLHVFEPRYKRMIRRCLKGREPFGVALIRRGREALGPPADPYEVGVSARVTFVEQLSQGRLNVIAVGQERFRIHSLGEQPEGYLVGDVEPHPITPGEPGAMRAAGRALRPWVRRYLRLLVDANLAKTDLKKLPADPLAFAYLATFLLQVPARQKQALLEIDHALPLIRSARSIYRREVALMEALVAEQGPADENARRLN